MTNRRRWDADTRGVGVRDATVARPSIEALIEAMSQPGWVAEDPELHLVPHLRAEADRAGVELARIAVVDGILEVSIAGRDRSPGVHRQTVIALVASIAEASTHIREQPDGNFEVVTGLLEGDGHFAAHGHLVRIRVE